MKPEDIGGLPSSCRLKY